MAAYRPDMRSNDYLFRRVDSFSVQRQQTERMQGEIAGMDANRLLNTNVDDLVGYFAEKYGIEVPELVEGEMVVDQREAQRDISCDPMRRFFYDRHQGPIMVTGTEILLEVPFSGDPQMFEVQPGTYNMNPPQGIVNGNILTTRLWGDNLNGDQVLGQINAWLGQVQQHLQWQRDSFRSFSVALAEQARNAIVRRRDQLLRNQNLVASLGIPLKRQPDALATYVAPEVRRKLAPKLPPATAGAFKPEPALEEAEYQHILGIMENMAQVLERSPKAFYNLDEAGLRTHFLVQLNGHYQGQATGETFNFFGKTDILLRSGDRNIFIAECKFWGGPSNLTDTIEQLLGYLSWRDLRLQYSCSIETEISQTSSLPSRRR